ncbi:hypothetical protein EG68_05324 [Paragonimus skrjabini miyazakii]|uniref:Poly [ADP-ribose] polymerase n=1 Tax=Paragonimus skrjabini miyazakii TaxID=59628 RepID=A0A8S9YCQ1_9TREM|nr:hypothetical protein EG68_05324 [Paragonimus skrjabini miyazakii]
MSDDVSHRRAVSVGNASHQSVGYSSGDFVQSASAVTVEPIPLSDSMSVQLFDACRNGDAFRVKFLLDNGACVDMTDSSGRKSTPLHFAAGYGHRDVVELLLERGADVNARDDGGLVPLHNACSFGHVDVVHLMLRAGSDPNARDCWNYTPLHEAAIKGKVEVCILLLQAKADLRARNLDGKTPIDLAEGSARLALLGDYRKDELLEAARSGNEEKLVSLLTPQNVNCHAGDGRKSTPLHLAAGYNRSKIVKILLANGADVVAKDKGGLIPLHNACSYGHLDVCELLLGAGSVQTQVHAADLWQYTPLHEAASKARAEVCSLLLAYGANPMKANCHGKSALDLVPTAELRRRLFFEFLGHCLLEAARSGEVGNVQRVLSSLTPPDTIDSQNINTCTDAKSNRTINGCPLDGTGDPVAASFGDTSSASVPDLGIAEVLRFRHPLTGNTVLHSACSPPDTITVADYQSLSPPYAGLDPNGTRSVCASSGQVTAQPKTTDHSTCATNHSARRQQLIEWLIQHHAVNLINDCNAEAQIPLHLAARNGFLEAAVCLAYHGSKINTVDAHGFTPLHLAANHGHAHVVRFLVQIVGGDGPTFISGNQPLSYATAPPPPLPTTSSCRRTTAETTALTLLGVPSVTLTSTTGADTRERHLVVDSTPSNSRSANGTPLGKQTTAPCTISNNDYTHELDATSVVTTVVQTPGDSKPQHLGSTRTVCSPPLVSTDSSTGEHPKPAVTIEPVSTSGHVPSARSFKPRSSSEFCVPNQTWADAVLRLLEAAKSGDVELVRRLITAHQNHEHLQKSLHSSTGSTCVDCATPGVTNKRSGETNDFTQLATSPSCSFSVADLINCRDIDGRHSTPLHFAAGYNRLAVVELLLQYNADVHAKDKGGLVPLHNACSYGHCRVAELLIQHGANVNVTDLWRFTPLHEAAAKGKFEICRLLLQHGADPTKKNRDGHTPIDLVKDTDSDVYDLLRGDIAVLEAAKRGNLAKLQRLITPANINCRDTQGRNSAPLHLAAGYNNVEVVEFLLESGADVNAKDKGGLIPLHNASSYGHVDVAALLIRYGTSVNAVDKWGYTPLHEAAQKGRTQLCSLLLAHGADAFIRNQENQIPIDLATADDVKSLLTDAMLHSNFTVTTVTKDTLASGSIFASDLATGSENATSHGFPLPQTDLSTSDCIVPVCSVGPRVEGQGQESAADGIAVAPPIPIHTSTASSSLCAPTSINGFRLSTSVAVTSSRNNNLSVSTSTASHHAHSKLTVASFLTALDLQMYIELFDKEEVTMDILAEMTHAELKELGVTVYGHRHKILKGLQRWRMSATSFGISNGLPLPPSAVAHLTVGMQNLSLSTVTGADATSVLSPALIPDLTVSSSNSVSATTTHFHGVGVSEATPTSPMYFPPGSLKQTVMIELDPSDPEFRAVEEQVQSTIREHRDNCGGVFKRYHLLKVARIRNRRLWDRYVHRCKEISEDSAGHYNERLLFHGSPFLQAIVMKGFDERHAYIGGMFGAGIYFAENSSKSNQYVYGIGGGTGCQAHKSRSCYVCPRQLLLCRVALGRSFIQFNAMKVAHAPPGHHSIVGRPSTGGLNFAEYVIYRGEQAYPEYLITYLLVPPDPTDSAMLPSVSFAGISVTKASSSFGASGLLTPSVAVAGGSSVSCPVSQSPNRSVSNSSKPDAGALSTPAVTSTASSSAIPTAPGGPTCQSVQGSV